MLFCLRCLEMPGQLRLQFLVLSGLQRNFAARCLPKIVPQEANASAPVGGALAVVRERWAASSSNCGRRTASASGITGCGCHSQWASAALLMADPTKKSSLIRHSRELVSCKAICHELPNRPPKNSFLLLFHCSFHCISVSVLLPVSVAAFSYSPTPVCVEVLRTKRGHSGISGQLQVMFAV